MVTNTGTGLARVVIVAPSRRFSVALPERVTLATLLPGLVRQAGEPAEPGDASATNTAAWSLAGWNLRRVNGAVLDPARTLAAQEIRDGEVLHLFPREADWPDVQYDDVVEAIAAGSRKHGVAWSPAATRRAGLCAAAVSLLVALAAIVQAGPPWQLSAALAIGIGLILLFAGTILARAAGDSMAGAVFGAVGIPYLFVGGLLILGQPQDAFTDFGAPHLLLAGVAMLVAAVIAQAGVSDGEGMLLAGVVCGAAAAGGAALGLTALDGVQSAAVVLALLVLIHPALPLIAVRMGKVPIPTMPQTVDDLVRDEDQPSTAKVFTAARRGNQILFGTVLGVSVSSAVCLIITASAGGLAAPLLTAVASLALLLRARAWRTVALRTPMLIAGGLGAVLCVLNIASRTGGSYPLIATVAVLLLTAAVLGTVGLVLSKRTSSPYPARIADIVDVVVVHLGGAYRRRRTRSLRCDARPS